MATLRELLNSSQLNTLADALGDLELGDLVVLMINELTATETGLSPTANVSTLATPPTSVFLVNVTAGASTGIKKLLKGPISGEDAVIPKAGEATWDGGTKILTNAADAATAVAVTYATATDVDSVTQRDLGFTNP